MDGQGGSADTRGTASWDGLTEPLQDSVLCRPLMLVMVMAVAVATTGAPLIVGGLCWLGTGLCLALGDLLSLRAVIGETVAWCRRFPGRMDAVACCDVQGTPSRCLCCTLASRVVGCRLLVLLLVGSVLVPAMVMLPLFSLHTQLLAIILVLPKWLVFKALSRVLSSLSPGKTCTVL